jgi:hypothetical protein
MWHQPSFPERVKYTDIGKDIGESERERERELRAIPCRPSCSWE